MVPSRVELVSLLGGQCQKLLAFLDVEAGEGGKDETRLASENSWGIAKFEQDIFLSWVSCLSFVSLPKIF